MPPLDGGEYLLDILFEIGPVTDTGFGAAAISEAELWAWQQNQRCSLRPWECAAIRRLSGAYASMMSKASDPTCDAPYSEEVVQVDHKALQAKFRAMAALRRGT